MPLCPQVIAVSKPKRARWCFEELSDVAVYLDGEARETEFPGVCIIYAGKPGSPERIDRALRFYKFSFARRVVVPLGCVGSRRELINFLEELFKILKKINNKNSFNIKIIISLRGRSKEYLDESSLRELLSKYGIRGDRRSRFILDIEGLGTIAAVSFGRGESCGYDCLLVRPRRIL